MVLYLLFLFSKVGNKVPILMFSFVFIRNKFIYSWIIDFILWDLLFLLWYCLVKLLDNIIQFLLKIILIWWDKFIYNFKYIFINEIGFIEENCNSCGQLNKK